MIAVVDATVVQSPGNVVAEVGDEVQFTCRSNSTLKIRWEHLSSQSNKLDIIFNGDKVTPAFEARGYSVRAVGSGSRMTIRSVEPEDARVFACLETGRQQKYAAELYILGN